MIVQGAIPMDGLSNEYHLTFRVHRSGKTLYAALLTNSLFRFKKLLTWNLHSKKMILRPFEMVHGRFTAIDTRAAAAPDAA